MPFFGWDMWSARGFGLGLAVIDDPAQTGLGAVGRRQRLAGGAFSTAWSNDPKEDMVMLMMPQLPMSLRQRQPSQADFLNLVYQAIDD